MASVTLKKGAKIERMERWLEKPTAALKQIGALGVAESQEAFREQSFDGKKWPERNPDKPVVNVFGVISDFSQGKTKPPNRRFQTTPALIDTGRLASSISFRLVSDDTVEWGTNIVYAPVHQSGGEVESEEITETVQRLLGAWLKKQSSAMKGRLGFLLNKNMTGEKLQGEVPQRRFVGVTKQLIEDVREVVQISLTGDL